jgi:hypothetical protein
VIGSPTLQTNLSHVSPDEAKVLLLTKNRLHRKPDALLALSALLQRNMRAASIVVGVLALIEAGYALVKISEAKSAAGTFGALISPGWGLYLTILAGIYLIASTWVAKTSAPAPAAEAA